MKKWIAVALLVSMASFVQAAKKSSSWTKEQYVASKKTIAKKKGQEFDQAKAEAKFVKLDTNADGILTAEEKAAGRKDEKKKK